LLDIVGSSKVFVQNVDDIREFVKLAKIRQNLVLISFIWIYAFEIRSETVYYASFAMHFRLVVEQGQVFSVSKFIKK